MANMEFSELALVRQSDRRYEERTVEREKIERCLETARISPSANNTQPWKFVVVEDPATKAQVADAATSMGMNKFVATAPVIVAIVLEKPGALTKLASVLKDKEFMLLDVGIAANQFCLQAADLGLGTCMVGWFDEKRVRKILGIPKHRRIPLLLTLGYPASATRPKSRKPVEDMSSWEQY